MKTVKDTLAVISVGSFVWLVFFGNLLEPQPATATVAVISLLGFPFYILLVLRIISFWIWLKSLLSKR